MNILSKYLLFILYFICLTAMSQVNNSHVKVSGYTRSDGTYVQPYFRTAPNSTNRDNFSTEGNTNPYTSQPGWVKPDNKYDTFYYNTYSYNPKSTQTEYATNSTLPIKFKNRTYIEDENGNYNCYLIVKDERTFSIYDMNDNLISFLVINHRGDWRIFDNNMIYIKTIFITTEK